MSNVSEKYIQRLIAIIKDVTASKNDFWDRLDQLSHNDIKTFVSKLNSKKEKGKHSLSELDYLWRQFQGIEFEPSRKEKKKKRFAEILEVLSEEQLNASFDSPEFLAIMNLDVYAEATANTITYKQMALFASDIKRHTILEKMIAKLKPAPDLFCKLVAIMPYATGILKENLINQLSQLPYSASFKIKLTELANYYIDKNELAYEANRSSNAGKNDSNKKPKTPSKWAKININTKPVYNTKPVEKKDWTDKAFERFIQDLHAKTYITIKDNIIEALNSMPDDRIKMIAERASLPEFKDLLQHYWVIESKTTNHNSYIEAREKRLKIILKNLSEDQLHNAIKENKFWDIFGNTQQPYCKMAADVLTPQQFKTIISNAELDRHTDFARIINYVNIDTPQDKTRLNDIIEATLPHTTPWLVLTLQLKIKNLLEKDKTHFKRLNADLRQYLNDSMTQ